MNGAGGFARDLDQYPTLVLVENCACVCMFGISAMLSGVARSSVLGDIMRTAANLLIAFFAVMIGACATTPAPSAEAQAPTVTPAAQAVPGAAHEALLAPAYRLGTGDQIRLIVFGEDDLSGEFFVDGAGNVSLPLVGEIAAAGRTLTEFRRQVEARLAEGYLTDPRVSAEVLNYRPFYILGEVEESGEYPYVDGLTVMNAVARAGGFTYRANTRTVFIKRADMETEVAAELTPNLRVLPGDTIRVGERFF